ncbi:galactose mutarotase isoform X2 [Amia ocellicauda]|uniref:galactose mutarotase isoform X2 n=1 Tax=Amia ocellicauda TaxID=2972642 RepID=UPI0034649ECB
MTQVTKEQFGTIPQKGSVEKFILKSDDVVVEIISLGCIITALKTKDKRGQFDDIVLGFDNLEGYCFGNSRYFGAVVGRVANRIAKGKFSVDGKEYQLGINNGPNALHGGLEGFDKAIWTSQALPNGVSFSLTSPDGDQGYPGELRAQVTYELAGEVLTVQFTAEASRTTPINLTNHSYFNLAGHAAPDIYDHEVSIPAEAYLPVDDTMIPTGEVRPVQGSPFDLRSPVLIGQRLKDVPGPGFDHNFCVSSPGEPLAERPCARVYHPGSGRGLAVSTTMPGMQFYTANFLDGSVKGKAGVAYPKHGAFCLETQNWPNAVNQAHFPDALLRPGEKYHHKTSFRFFTA